ncbi:MAG: hypothetical protein ACTSVD_07500 [Candidatus Thorarchaeota archaeon]|nr:MAG: hypothetical protein DRO93_02850 [Candidatus Thorarchaeota archaeon]
MPEPVLPSDSSLVEGIKAAPYFRMAGRGTRVVTLLISAVLAVVWASRLALGSLEIGVLVVVMVLLGAAANHYHGLVILVENDGGLVVRRPGVSWTASAEAVLGCAIVAAGAYFLVNSTVLPSDGLRATVLLGALLFTVLCCPILLLFSSLPFTNWLKTVVRISLNDGLIVSVTRTTVFSPHWTKTQKHALSSEIRQQILSRSQVTNTA